MTKSLRNHPKPDAGSPLTSGFLRRVTAMAYDALLLVAVFFLATAIALPFNGGQAFSPSQTLYPLYLVYLLAVSFLFYAWFWTHGGQTPGLKAWNLRVESEDGHALSWRQAAIRFGIACLSGLCFGLGFVWCVFDKQHRTWHDYGSKTRMVRLSNKPKSSRQPSHH